MHVVKRNGKPERVQFDKITSRISKLAYGLNMQFVDPVLISQKCIKGVFNGVTTSELDSLAAEIAVRPRPAPPLRPSLACPRPPGVRVPRFAQVRSSRSLVIRRLT